MARMGFVGNLAWAWGLALVCGSFSNPAVAADVSTSGAPAHLAQAAESNATYTPIRRPGSPQPAPSSARAVPSLQRQSQPAQVVQPTPYLPPSAYGQSTPSYAPYAPAAPPAPATTIAPSVRYAPPTSPAPTAPVGYPSPQGGAAEGGASPTVAKRALPVKRPGHSMFGLATDVGMPDGINLGLVVEPADWVRLGASAGTNTAALDYRGGLTFVPVGWGPSFTFEFGHCNVAPVNSVLGTFFNISSWIKPYAQELGYTYFNAHLGVDIPIGRVALYLHGGYTYLMATVRGPNPVVVSRNTADQSPSMTVEVPQDGEVHAHTLSVKLGIIYMFGGGS